jgi:hypothetical protein
MDASSQLVDARLWRSLYVAALFEADSAILPDRIVQAQAVLVHGARELFYAPGDHIEEEEALNDAMYALRALRNAYRNGCLTAESGTTAAQFRLGLLSPRSEA